MATINNFKLFWPLFLLISLAYVNYATVDNTIVEKSIGQDVTEQVIRLISRSSIFSDDKNFLRRVAFVESAFGQASHTFPIDYFGGIWQLDEDKYDLSKDASLTSLHQAIQNIFNISWAGTSWGDCLKPLYSGLATRLYLAKTSAVIPGLLNEQAQLWKTSYNNNASWNSDYFIGQVQGLEAEAKCDGLFDMCIIMDGSGSVHPTDFNLAKQFTANLVSTFSLNTTGLGFIVYSDSSNVIFDLENELTADDMKSAILNAYHPRGGTATGEAIFDGINLLTTSNATVRPGVPKLMAVFTDGWSNSFSLVIQASQLAYDMNITSFAIGIGSGVNQEELEVIAHNNTDHVFTTRSYLELAEFFKRFNEQACEQPQTPGFEQVVEDSLKQDEKRYYKYELPEEGVTIRITASEGGVTGYWSYTESIPSSAFHDGIIGDGDNFIPSRSGNSNNAYVLNMKKYHEVRGDNSDIYISIQGLEEINDYSLEAVIGNIITSPSTEVVTEVPTTIVTEPPSTEHQSSPPTTTEPVETTTPSASMAIKPELLAILVTSIFLVFMQKL